MKSKGEASRLVSLFLFVHLHVNVSLLLFVVQYMILYKFSEANPDF